MNKDNAKDFLPLVQALADGKTIQHRATFRGPWEDMEKVRFGANVYAYRIKPEPVTEEIVLIWYKSRSSASWEYWAVFVTAEKIARLDEFMSSWTRTYPNHEFRADPYKIKE